MASTTDAATTATATTATTTLFAGSKKNVGFQEVQDTVSRLAAHKGVTSVLILNKDGDILTQTGSTNNFGNPKYLKKTLDAASVYIKTIPKDDDDDDSGNPNDETGGGAGGGGSNNSSSNPTRDISFVRIRSRNEEILVAPKNNYVLVVLQDPNESPL